MSPICTSNAYDVSVYTVCGHLPSAAKLSWGFHQWADRFLSWSTHIEMCVVESPALSTWKFVVMSCLSAVVSHLLHHSAEVLSKCADEFLPWRYLYVKVLSKTMDSYFHEAHMLRRLYVEVLTKSYFHGAHMLKCPYVEVSTKSKSIHNRSTHTEMSYMYVVVLNQPKYRQFTHTCLLVLTVPVEADVLTKSTDC